MKVLLLSNSSLPGQAYLEFAKTPINDFLPGASKIAFIPFAAVTFSFEEYHQKVVGALGNQGYEIESVHASKDPVKTIEESDGIMVGGGNTFALLKRIREFGLFDVIQDKVRNGDPYVGWSAGSNLAGPTICTTNDMPIVNPGTFDAFGFVPFQINPHYIEANPEGHMGETRDQRLEEFIEMNQGTFVVAIPEGTYLTLSGDEMRYHGAKPGRLFKHGRQTETFDSSVDLSFLFN